MAGRPEKDVHEVQSLLASGAITATGTGTPRICLPISEAIGFVLDITVDESTAADKLDVFVQTRVDVDGTENWLDVVHFTQNNGNDGAKQYVEKITRGLDQAGYEAGTALTEGLTRHIFGDVWRARYVVIDDSGSASFTCSVTAIPM